MDEATMCEMDPVTWDALVSWMRVHGVADEVVGKVCSDALTTISTTPSAVRDQAAAEAGYPEFVSHFFWDRRDNRATLEFVTDQAESDLDGACFEHAEHPTGSVAVLFGADGLVYAVEFANAEAQLSPESKAAAVKVPLRDGER